MCSSNSSRLYAPRVGVTVNNLKLVFSDAYLDSIPDVVIVIRKPRFVRRLIRMQEALYRSASSYSPFLSPVVVEAQYREDLAITILEAFYGGADIFSKSQARKIKNIPHPVLSDFKFY